MIPIASTVFWGPMAFAIMGGLLVATVLTLIFLPALYVAFLRIREPAGQRKQRRRLRTHDQARPRVGRRPPGWPDCCYCCRWR